MHYDVIGLIVKMISQGLDTHIHSVAYLWPTRITCSSAWCNPVHDHQPKRHKIGSMSLELQHPSYTKDNCQTSQYLLFYCLNPLRCK